MTNAYASFRERNEFLRRARNAQFYAAYSAGGVRAAWIDCASKYATAARRANWRLVRALREYRP